VEKLTRKVESENFCEKKRILKSFDRVRKMKKNIAMKNYKNSDKVKTERLILTKEEKKHLVGGADPVPINKDDNPTLTGSNANSGIYCCH